MADPAIARLAALGLAAAELAHELHNVLATIAASAHAAAHDPADRARLLARVTKHAELGQRLVEDVMFLASGASVELEPAPTTDVLAAARATMTRNASFDDRVGTDTVWVHGTLFPRLLHALYANAVAVGSTRIVTRVAETEAEVTIDVEDDGPGVPAALRDRLFQPFVTERAGGMGLGLALARRIAEAHGGDLTLRDDCTHTTFRITLPRR